MKKLFFIVAAWSLFAAGCQNSIAASDKIKVENKLNKKIICILGYYYPNLKLNFTSSQAIMADSNRFMIDTGKTKIPDTLGLCNKNVWDKYIKQNLVMLFVFDAKKLAGSNNPEDALIERYYFSYTQLIKARGVITVD